jgi:hypothetical protein
MSKLPSRIRFSRQIYFWPNAKVCSALHTPSDFSFILFLKLLREIFKISGSYCTHICVQVIDWIYVVVWFTLWSEWNRVASNERIILIFSDICDWNRSGDDNRFHSAWFGRAKLTLGNHEKNDVIWRESILRHCYIGSSKSPIIGFSSLSLDFHCAFYHFFLGRF